MQQSYLTRPQVKARYQISEMTMWRGTSEWALTVTTDVKAPSPLSQHVAAYFQTHKDADACSWAIATELADKIPNPTTGTIAFENGLFVKGTDNNNQRAALHFALGIHETASKYDVNEISYGIWLTGPPTGPDNDGGLRIKKGIEYRGNFRIGLDLCGINNQYGYDVAAIAMRSGAKLAVYDQLNGTMQASLSWDNSAGWALTGVGLSASAIAGVASALPAQPANYKFEKVNGIVYRIPLYN